MTLILENGSGVRGANSYVTPAYVTAYLAERNRSTEGGWTSPEGAEESAACIAGTDYIEQRWRYLFLGRKEHRDISQARATWTPTVQPLDTETVTVGSVVYRFVAALAVANDVLIGAALSLSVDNLVAAINAAPEYSGVGFHASTVQNPDASAMPFIDDALVALSRYAGTRGNTVVTTTTVTGATWNFATLVGGSDIVIPQPLSFPRADLFDRDGIPVVGMPPRLLFCAAEYSVRARAAALAPDPTKDALGGTITSLREVVGPIETEVSYVPGTANSGSLPAYPAADRLIREYIAQGGVIRG